LQFLSSFDTLEVGKGGLIMKNILITGALGQVGTALTKRLQKEYGFDHVLATGLQKQTELNTHYAQLDVLDGESMHQLVKQYQIDSIIHLAALLSATAENNPLTAWDVNMNGLMNVLKVAKDAHLQVFTPSSIAAFGYGTPPDLTPQDTMQRPTTMYGVTKVSGELLCDYFHRKFDVDTRGVRYPGLISHESLPGGGTTDYAVHIFYEALRTGSYTSPIAPGTKMDMMYMPDALDAIVQLMEADPGRLIHRNAFNVTAMSFAPEDLAASIQHFLPKFQMDYDVNPKLQAIADSWPNSLDDSAAREEWDWKPHYDLDRMTEEMLVQLQKKIHQLIR
jgi:nucleoside-diphosphate-sugar epimerase